MRAIFLAAGLLIMTAIIACAQGAGKSSVAGMQHAFIDQYCTGCHNDKIKSSGLSFTSLEKTLDGRIEQGAPEWEKVIAKLQAGMMPPAGMPRPDIATIKAFVTSLETGIDQVSALHPRPGRPPMHRLNRTEYGKSIHDLLGVDVDVASFLPADDMSHGFDNMSDTLSPTLIEGYVRAAGKISREAVGDTTMVPVAETYKLPRIFSQMRHVEGTPIGTRGGMAVTHNFPADGEYIFRMTFYYSGLGVFFGRLEKSQQIEVAVDGERAALLDINPTMKLNDELLTAAVKVKAGPRVISAAFINRAEGPVEDVLQPIEQSLVDVSNANIPGLTSLPHLHDLTIRGPYNITGVSETPSRQRIFTCRPAAGTDEFPCARNIIARLARQAYRKPVTETEMEELLNFYQTGRNDGNFETGIRTAIQGMIANPRFVFRFELPPAGVAPGASYRISDLELASRLSYFLWSSGPDDELITVASRNKLHEPATLEQQVRRMMTDVKSDALAENFASQWLHLQNLKDVRPDDYQYPDFDENLRRSMTRETQLLFSSIMREDRPVLDLLTANYTFVDERLAKHYGIPNVLGNRFRRVDIPEETRRGLLGQASILTLTSLATRTSPVSRGKWVMDVILGTPPPAPPPNVPPLKDNLASERPTTSVRERMEQHRQNEPCASCHKMMDPIGFSLDNFDAVGLWRINDSGFRVDPSGKMFDGSKLDGPGSLRQALLGRSDAFLRTFTGNLLAYGIGRVLESSDMPVVRAIDREAARSNNRFSSFVLGIVKSQPFQMTQADGAASAPTNMATVGPVTSSPASVVAQR